MCVTSADFTLLVVLLYGHVRQSTGSSSAIEFSVYIQNYIVGQKISVYAAR